MTTEITEIEGLPELASRVARLEGVYEGMARELASLDRRVEGLGVSIELLLCDLT